MGLHNPFDRDFFLIGGAVKLTGGSLNLAKGQLALIDTKKSTVDGVAVLTTTAGKKKSAKDLELRLGVSKKRPDRSHTDKAQSTVQFSLDDIVDLRVSTPKHTEQTVDEVIIGYNGIDPSTAFDFKSGDSYFRMTMELSGDAIAYRGADSPLMGGREATELVSINVEIPSCDPLDNCGNCDDCTNEIDCKAITIEAIERLKNKQLAGGVTVDKFVDITPVFSCDSDAVLTEIAYDFYILEVCDTGTDSALALVAQQYDTQVIRVERIGATSTYQVLLPNASGAPTDYAQSLASIIKGCDTCPAGYTATDEGVLYAVTIEDNGVDKTAVVQALPGAVAGTAEKADGTSAGIGFYTVILNDALTSAEIATFLTTDASTASATLDNLGNVEAICENGTITNIAWVVGDTCNVVEQDYTLTLPDTECGATRLGELQAAYQETVALAPGGTNTVDLTLTGATGSADITIEGNVYNITFVTDLGTTATNFVVAEESNIETGSDYTISEAAGVLTITGPVDGWVLPTIVNTATDLAGTLGAVTEIGGSVACQTRYNITVVSDIVCDECDDIFKDYYKTEAPEAYDGEEWVLVDANSLLPSGECLCGIRVKGKTFTLNAEEALRDRVGFVETSTKVRIAAGYPEEIREGIGRIPTGTFKTTQISRWVERTHLAGNMRDMENESRAYFRGYDYKDYLGRLLRGEISNLEDQTVQYVHYTLQVNPSASTQSFGQRISDNIDYGIYVEVGRHNAVEDLLNDLASNAGVNTVKAFG